MKATQEKSKKVRKLVSRSCDYALTALPLRTKKNLGFALILLDSIKAIIAPVLCVFSKSYRDRRLKEKNYASVKRFYVVLGMEFVFGALFLSCIAWGISVAYSLGQL
jgi:hypothetical protein